MSQMAGLMSWNVQDFHSCTLSGGLYTDKLRLSPSITTNTRSSGADDALRLTAPKLLSLEESLDFIDTDELLEVTPKTLRIRKKILDPKMRKRGNRS